jgi:hypothetical protein
MNDLLICVTVIGAVIFLGPPLLGVAAKMITMGILDGINETRIKENEREQS